MTSEMHTLTDTSAYSQLLRVVEGRQVVEYGVGTGVLTRMLLAAGTKKVTGYEIMPDVCAVQDDRFLLITDDYTKHTWSEKLGDCVVANPAYETLPHLIENVLPCVVDAILMVPGRIVPRFEGLGFRVQFVLPGTSFDPAAKGEHFVMMRGFERKRFVDLHHQTMLLKATTIVERIKELAQTPTVALTAIGGTPIRQFGDRFFWWGELTPERIRQSLIDGLGLSAVLTYTNKQGKSLRALGQVCLDRDEKWAYHYMTFTLFIAGFSPSVHLAFSRDTRFKLGWAVTKEPSLDTLAVFTASGTVRDWLKFTRKHVDSSFDLPTRAVMLRANQLLEEMTP